MQFWIGHKDYNETKYGKCKSYANILLDIEDFFSKGCQFLTAFFCAPDFKFFHNLLRPIAMPVVPNAPVERYFGKLFGSFFVIKISTLL